MSRQIVVLAAGKGTRMNAPVPKVLIPLRGKPVIEHLLEDVNNIAQDTAPVIVVGFQADLVERTLGSKYIYAQQIEQKGTAHAVLSAQAKVTADNMIVLYGDMPFVTAESLRRLIQLHESTGSKLSMFTGIVPNFSGIYEHFQGFGRIIRDDFGRIIKIRERVDCSEVELRITEINPGIYMFKTDWLWPHLQEIGHGNAQDEYYLTDIVEIAMRSQLPIASLPIAIEEIYGINTPDHLSHAQTLLN